MVREDGGTVELLRIEKQGQTEIPVTVTFSGGVNECACALYYVNSLSECIHVTLYVGVCICACVNSCVCVCVCVWLTYMYRFIEGSI